MKFFNSTIGKSIVLAGACSLSFAVGMIAEKIFLSNKTKFVGNLRIDRSEENEAPKIFLELTTDFNDLKTLETANIRVLNENYLKSQN